MWSERGHGLAVPLSLQPRKWNLPATLLLAVSLLISLSVASLTLLPASPSSAAGSA